MTDYTKSDFILTAFASREAIETAAQSLVALDGQVTKNIGRAAWGLAVLAAIEQPELATSAIVADVALAMGLATGKGERHQPLSSRLRSALGYVRRDDNTIAVPTVTGADDAITAIAKAERFVIRYNVTAMAQAGADGRSSKSTASADARKVDAEKAERATLAAVGVTAKVPFSLSAVMDADDFTGIMAGARSGDDNCLKMAQHIVRTLQAAIVAGTSAQEARKPRAKRPARAKLAAVA